LLWSAAVAALRACAAATRSSRRASNLVKRKENAGQTMACA
jgi:hypothetical protein